MDTHKTHAPQDKRYFQEQKEFGIFIRCLSSVWKNLLKFCNNVFWKISIFATERKSSTFCDIFYESKSVKIYQRVKNVHFSENLACFLFLSHPFWDLPFALLRTTYQNLKINANDLTGACRKWSIKGSK